MLRDEALWLGERLRAWPADRGVVINLGSSSAAFRTETQPWIEQLVFAPARTRGIRVVHQDLFAAAGVDIAGDVLTPACQAQLRALQVFGIVCSNVLEHVIDRRQFARVLAQLLPPGGRALVSVPNRFPHHPDPIDTGFRPDPSQLLALFPELQAVDAQLLRCGRLLDLVRANPERVLRRGAADRRSHSEAGASTASPAPLRRLRDWLPYLLRSFRMTCVELVRPL